MSKNGAVAGQIARELGVDRCIVIYPVGDKTAVDWIGMTNDQVVHTLYRVGDGVLTKRIPVAHPNAPEGPKRGD